MLHSAVHNPVQTSKRTDSRRLRLLTAVFFKRCIW